MSSPFQKTFSAVAEFYVYGTFIIGQKNYRESNCFACRLKIFPVNIFDNGDSLCHNIVWEVIPIVINATDRELSIARLQHNLPAIRKIAGWTTEQMGDKIGVSKQTISNLENGKSPMNFTQYIAIRSVLDCEMDGNPENDVLPKVISILLDSDDDAYEKYREPVSVVAASAAGGVSVGALAGVLAAVVPLSKFGRPVKIACASWLKNILKNK